MRKLLLIGVVVAVLPGCLQVFPLLPFIEAKKVEIGLIGLGAGTVSSLESAAANAVVLEKEIAK